MQIKGNRTETKHLRWTLRPVPIKPYDIKKSSNGFSTKAHRMRKKDYFELFLLFAHQIITCLLLNDRVVQGIIADQLMSKAGTCPGY